MSLSYLLPATSVFLGAFLLFAVQPIAGKQLLPFFGGSSSVWATSLVFFTAMLFVGYAYVYGLTRLERRAQFFTHALLVAVATILALLPLLPFDALRFPLGGTFEEMPVFGVLGALLFLVGAPFLLLATTGPLMQYWYGTSTGREPYVLYALSNAASLIALLSYPFVIEPFFSLQEQRGIWIGLFFLYAAVYVASTWIFFRSEDAKRETERAPRVSWTKMLFWVALAALPSFALVAVTTQITQTIAPVPLLWVVPLALYLITFIVAFRGWGQSIFTPLFFFASATVAWSFTPAAYDELVFQVLSYLALLFFCGLSCHVVLYQSRPGAASSPLFYLALSFGGALGVVFASVVSPLIFTSFVEFPIAIALSAAFATWILPISFFPRILIARHVWTVKIFFIALVISPLTLFFVFDQDSSTIASRNFYGSAKVEFEEETTSLRHGTTLHGMQYVESADALLPTTYYTPGSGVGRSILYAEEARGEDEVRVGVIGLGTGTIAAYCRPGDTYVFYEIDSRIERIARSYFSYLSSCGGAAVRIGDGRIVLEGERTRGEFGMYDVIAVDAFSDDTIPVHLLTLEALELYISHLRGGDSILAIHISNRYLDLSPVVFRLAAELGMSAMLVSDDGDTSPGGSASAWIALSKDPNVFASTAFANTGSGVPEASSEIWTDNYSSLLPVIDISLPWE